MSIDLASQFSFPAEALADFQHRGGIQVTNQTNDVVQYEAGNSKLPLQHSFELVRELKVAQSELYDMEIYEDIEVIQFIVPEKKINDLKVHERVTALPAQLLKFRKIQRTNAAVEKLFYFDGSPQMTFERDENGNLICTGGLLKDSYLRWRSGLKNPGLKLEAWGRLSGAEVKTLHSQGVFTMEQFLAIPESELARYPLEIQQRFEDAKKWKRTKDLEAPNEETPKLVKELEIMRREREEMFELVKSMKSELDTLKAKEAPAKPRGRPRKVIQEVAE